MRHRIVIQTVAMIDDGYGDPAPGTPAPFATVWADVQPLKGDEAFQGKQLQSQVDHRFVIRHMAGITTQMQISWDNRIFNIESVLNIRERGKKIEIMAKEKVL